MKDSSKLLRTIRGQVGLLLGLLTASNVALGQSLGNSQVVQPNSTEFGNTYGEWSARWWQWLVSIPADTNPNFSSGNVDCTLGQSGPVWFLGEASGTNCPTRVAARSRAEKICWLHP